MGEVGVEGRLGTGEVSGAAGGRAGFIRDWQFSFSAFRLFLGLKAGFHLEG